MILLISSNYTALESQLRDFEQCGHHAITLITAQGGKFSVWVKFKATL